MILAIWKIVSKHTRQAVYKTNKKTKKKTTEKYVEGWRLCGEITPYLVEGWLIKCLKLGLFFFFIRRLI